MPASSSLKPENGLPAHSRQGFHRQVSDAVLLKFGVDIPAKAAGFCADAALLILSSTFFFNLTCIANMLYDVAVADSF